MGGECFLGFPRRMGKGRQKFRLTRCHEFGSPYQSDRTQPAYTYTWSHVCPQTSNNGMKNSIFNRRKHRAGPGLIIVQIIRCGSLSRRSRVRGQEFDGVLSRGPPHNAVPVRKALVHERLVGGALPMIPHQDKRANLNNNNPATGSLNDD